MVRPLFLSYVCSHNGSEVSKSVNLERKIIMSEKRIKFTVKKNGGGAFKVETEGFTGSSCDTAEIKKNAIT